MGEVIDKNLKALEEEVKRMKWLYKQRSGERKQIPEEQSEWCRELYGIQKEDVFDQNATGEN